MTKKMGVPIISHLGEHSGTAYPVLGDVPN